MRGILSRRTRRCGSVELLQGEEFDALFSDFERDTFHLKVHDTSYTPEESGPFHLYLKGEYDDFAWFQPWLDLVRHATSAGRTVRSARAVTVPHAHYTRWGLAVAEHKISAGEGVRWLPRHLVNADALSADDFWPFDDALVVFTILEPGGRFGGGAATRDPVIVNHCRAVRDRAWQAAIPHHRYLETEYITVQDPALVTHSLRRHAKHSANSSATCARTGSWPRLSRPGRTAQLEDLEDRVRQANTVHG